MTDNPYADRLTLVIRRVPDLTAELAGAVYEAAGGECEVGMQDWLLYIEVPTDAARGWARTPELLAAVRRLVPDAELVRVEAADIVTAAERSRGPLRSSA
ncbi:MAG: hypothetical protein WD009_00285 [Phycisphaeraceae bacterium]